MSKHRCDPSPDVAGGDVTRLRVFALHAAGLADLCNDQGAIEPVIAEFGRCPRCLRQVLRNTLGWTMGLLAKHEADPALWIDFHLAEAIDALKRQADER